MCSLCSLLTINTLLKGKFYTHHLPHVWCRLLIDDCTSHELADGYAFSQEEGGSVTQTDVIRAYDTNLPKPDGN
uniref:Uncharacterized protein n=1 Tax=Anopheles arabiensis TaxID=7173 RepID=A0A182HNH7_ANOAR